MDPRKAGIPTSPPGLLVVVDTAGQRTLMGTTRDPRAAFEQRVRDGKMVALRDVVQLASVELPMQGRPSALVQSGGPPRGELVLQHASRPCMLDHAPCPVPEWHGLVVGYYWPDDFAEPARSLYHASHEGLVLAGARNMDELLRRQQPEAQDADGQA